MQVFDTVGLDPTLPDVSLKIGGKERHLCFDYNAICVAEKVTGINLLKSVFTDLDASKLRGFLWAALLREDPKLTIDEVGSWLTLRNFAVVHTAILTAWVGSMPEESEDQAPGEVEGQTHEV